MTRRWEPRASHEAEALSACEALLGASLREQEHLASVWAGGGSELLQSAAARRRARARRATRLREGASPCCTEGVTLPEPAWTARHILSRAEGEAASAADAAEAAVPFHSTLMPDEVRARLRVGVSADPPRQWDEGASGGFGCSLCAAPEELSEREEAVTEAVRCPACAEPTVLEGLELGHRVWLNHAEAPSPGDGSRWSPWSLAQAREVLGRRRVYPGATFLFCADSTHAVSTGHDVSATLAGPCWELELGGAGSPRAWLVVWCSGTSADPVRIGSYTMVPPLTPDAGDPMAHITGGWACGGPSDPHGPGEILPTHGVSQGIVLENACHIELEGLELEGFNIAVRLLGHCWHVTLSLLHLHHNARVGLHARACPELYREWDEACISGQDELAGTGKPAWLVEARGYPCWVEVSRCLFEDNGWGGDSASTNFAIQTYCTNFHVHDCLFFHSAAGRCEWEAFPPAPALKLQAGWQAHIKAYDTLVAEVGTVSDCADCDTWLGEMRAACCGNMTDELGSVDLSTVDPDTHTRCSNVTTDARACSCDPGDDPASTESVACVEAAVRYKICQGYLPDPLGAGECTTRSGDGITFEGSSSGHVIEHCTFVGLRKNCGAWSRTDQGGMTWVCTDTSDGDGVDVKGLRVRTPNCQEELTVIRHNLFLFNEGPGVQIIDGSQGLEVYRNVFAGNGQGVRLLTGDNTHFRDEWRCATRGDVTNPVTLETQHWLETGCVRIYRNLFVENGRTDGACSGGHMGEGATIVVDAGNLLSYHGESGTEAATRVRDIWIVHNTFDSNPAAAVNVNRVFDCNSDPGLHPWAAHVPGSAPCDEPTGEPIRVTGVHVLNNVFSENNTQGNSPCQQANFGSSAVQWVGTYLIKNHVSEEADELRPFAEVFEVDHNLHFGPEGWDDPSEDRSWRVIRYTWAQQDITEFVVRSEKEAEWHEYAWHDFHVDVKGGEDAFASWKSTNYVMDAFWDWNWLSTTYGYDFQADWGLVEPKWAALPGRWHPFRFHLDPGSIPATTGRRRTGLLDHGVYSQRIGGPVPTSAFLVDVADGPDLFYETWGLPYIGALRPLELGIGGSNLAEGRDSHVSRAALLEHAGRAQ